MKKPFFSIIIPTYNRAKTILSTIQSVLNQSFHNWELLIIDDGSTDNTKSLIKSFIDKRIIYIYQENSERSEARNNGIVNAKGDYICFIDSDDLFHKNHLLFIFKSIQTHKNKKAIYITGQSVLHMEKLQTYQLKKWITYPLLFSFLTL